MRIGTISCLPNKSVKNSPLLPLDAVFTEKSPQINGFQKMQNTSSEISGHLSSIIPAASPQEFW